MHIAVLNGIGKMTKKENKTHEGSMGTDRNPPSGTDNATYGKWHGGKGSARKDSDQKKYEDGWDRIFGKKK